MICLFSSSKEAQRAKVRVLVELLGLDGIFLNIGLKSQDLDMKSQSDAYESFFKIKVF